ncbi:MAG: hypothetical protein AAGI49_06880 [Bacteroidota bacterium]
MFIKNNNAMSRLAILFFVLLLPVLSIAQRKIVATPLSFSEAFRSAHTPNIPIQKIAPPSKARVAQQQSKSRTFSIPNAMDIRLGQAGVWTEMANGDRLWQMEIAAPDAKGLILMYDDFYLPEGSKLFVYSPDRSQVLGAYTSQNNNAQRVFLTGILRGESAIVEYYEPAWAKKQGTFRIFRVDYVFEQDIPYSDHPFQQMSGLGFGASAACQVDVNCETSEAVEEMKRGVCRIMMVLEEGTGWCTGNLMNNTAQDGRPLVLSAYHCFDGFTPRYDLWRFDFNYEHMSCESTDVEPDFQSLLGCELRAFWADSDFSLFEITQPIPQTYQAYFNGWDARMQTRPSAATFIHHPRADVKKLTTDESRVFIFPTAIEWNNDFTTPPNHHFSVGMNEGGGFEIGSSGGALFDENRRIVGQLHGGFSDTLCRNSTAYFGRLAMSWEGGGSPDRQLRPWLDPLNTGDLQVAGVENPVETMFSSVSGSVALPDGRGIVNVQLTTTETTLASTDIAGNFLLEALPVGSTYEIIPQKNLDLTNGTSVLDLVDMQKHNLARAPFTSIYQMIAGDVNNSKSLTVFDLIELQKVMLGRATSFPDNTSWRFLPTTFDASLEDFDFTFPESTTMEVQPINANLNFIGVKVGDVNNSVDPAE